MRRLRTFSANISGAAAAEFALVLPAALLLLLGTFDIGRYLWELNQLEKAVQLGTRYAVATNVVAQGLNSLDYTGLDCGSGAIKPGDDICKDALGKITCGQSSGSLACTCTESSLGSGTCPTDTSADPTAFAAIVNRMRVITNVVNPGNVRVSYSGSGIGFADDPAKNDDGDDLSDMSPLVTVEVTSFRFRSMSLLGAGITLPGFRYTQTLEDGYGAIAY